MITPKPFHALALLPLAVCIACNPIILDASGSSSGTFGDSDVELSGAGGTAEPEPAAYVWCAAWDPAVCGTPIEPETTGADDSGGYADYGDPGNCDDPEGCGTQCPSSAELWANDPPVGCFCVTEPVHELLLANDASLLQVYAEGAAEQCIDYFDVRGLSIDENECSAFQRPLEFRDGIQCAAIGLAPEELEVDRGSNRLTGEMFKVSETSTLIIEVPGCAYTKAVELRGEVQLSPAAHLAGYELHHLRLELLERLAVPVPLLGCEPLSVGPGVIEASSELGRGSIGQQPVSRAAVEQLFAVALHAGMCVGRSCEIAPQSEPSALQVRLGGSERLEVVRSGKTSSVTTSFSPSPGVTLHVDLDAAMQSTSSAPASRANAPRRTDVRQ